MPLEAEHPPGSLIFEPRDGDVVGSFEAVNDPDTLSIELDAGQTLLAGLFVESGIRGKLEVFDPNNTLLDSREAPGVGQDLITPLIRVETDGTYQFKVTSLEGTGVYRVGFLLDAAVDNEFLGGTNNTIGTAQDLNASALFLPNGVSRLAVNAEVDSPSDVDVYAFDLPAGQVATVVAVPRDPNQPLVHVELTNGVGTPLATGIDQVDGTTHIARFRSPQPGTYYAHVSSDVSTGYLLVITRGADFEEPWPDRGVGATDLTEVGQALGALDAVPRPGGGAIRVAALNAGNVTPLVDQLNNDTFFNFDAVSVTALDIDTLSELNTFDVVLIGDPASGAALQSLASVLRTWATTSGHVVGVGGLIQAAGANSGLSIDAINAIDEIVPVRTAVASTLIDNPTIDVQSTLHPVTQALSDFVLGANLEVASQDAGSGIGRFVQTLATVNGQPAVVVSQPFGQWGGPRSVWLGPRYGDPSSMALRTGSADQLLEQAVAWASGGDVEDSYLFSATAGDHVIIETTTPFDGPREPQNTLDPNLALVTIPNVTRVDFNEDKTPGERNARIDYTIPQGGTGRYVVTVGGAGTGPYTLSVTGTTPVQGFAPFVEATNPANGTRVNPAHAQTLDLIFSEGLRLDSVNLSDLSIDGGASVTAMSVLDGRTIRFSLSVPNTEQTYTYSVAAGAFTDLQGQPSQAYQGSFVLDKTGPRVTGHSPALTTGAPFSQLVLTFNEAIDPASVSKDDISSFTGPPFGFSLLNQITNVSAAGNQVTIQFNPQSATGGYSLVLGPNITDLAGNAMDQTPDGLNGQANDSYQASVAVTQPPSLSINSVSVSEGNAGTTQLMFTVSLSAASTQDVTVNYSTMDGTARSQDPNADYVAASGIVTFGPSETSQSVFVTINGDVVFEDDEQFTVVLSNPVNATIATSTGTGTILNDDPLPTLSIADVTRNEGNSGTTPFEFTITLSNPSSEIVTVEASTFNESATAGSDYQAIVSQLITFDPGQTTKTLTVSVFGDTVFEDDEIFQVILGNLTGATFGDAIGIGTILNDEIGAPGSIRGQKFDDLDGDGRRDPSEVGLNGVTIELVRFGTDAVVATQTTHNIELDGQPGFDPVTEQGLYEFQNVTPGTYLIREVLPPGRAQTFPALPDDPAPAHVVTLNPGQSLGQWLVDAPVVSDPDANWVHRLVAGQETILVGVTVGSDVTLDGQADFYQFFSGPMTIQWGAPIDTNSDGIKDQSDLTILSLQLTGADTGGGVPSAFRLQLGPTPSVGFIQQTAEATDADSGLDIYLMPEGGPDEIPIHFTATISEVPPYSTTYTYSGPPIPREPPYQLTGLTLAQMPGLDFGNRLVNQPPVITSNGGGPTAVVSLPENQILVTTVVATDADLPAQTLSYSLIGGADAAKFTIDPTTGVLSFLVAPDFEHPTDADLDNVYDVIVQVTDSGTPSLNDGQAISVTVGDVIGAEFRGLGDLPGGDFSSSARGVSADGSVAVGFSNSASGVEAFRWTEAGGIAGLGDFPDGDFFSYAQGASADGGVVVGSGVSASGQEAFRWTQAEGLVGLGDLAGGISQSNANGVSADGTVVVGQGWSESGNEAFRWTRAGGMVGLGDLAEGNFGSYATGVSADGSVVVGQGNSTSGPEAFRWTQAGGMVGLGALAGGQFNSQATDISADGAVVVGHSWSTLSYEAFRWTQASGMVGLGVLAGGGIDSYATGVSADGTVVVGYGGSASPEAFIWDAVHGMRKLQDVLLSDYGLGPSLGGWILQEAVGVSADGQTLVGYGINPSGQIEAWRVTGLVPLPTFAINDVAVTEGNSGTKTAIFTITKTGATTLTSTVDVSTADGTTNPATAGSDYVALLQTLTFAPEETTRQVTVTIYGDTTFEADETFVVNLTNPTNATIVDNQGLGTILNDDQRPTMTITDVARNEGDFGATNFDFIVTLSNPSIETVTVTVSTADGTATAGSDYQAIASQLLIFNPGETSKTPTVTVFGNGTPELDETFEVVLSSPTNASISDNSGLGTILNDDIPTVLPTLTIDNVTLAEGDAGQKNFDFTVTLMGESFFDVVVDFETSNSEATTADNDYVATNGQIHFAPGTGPQTRTITVPVIGDHKVEPNESFLVLLTNATNALLTNSLAFGTIANDDTLPTVAIGNDVVQAEGDTGQTNFNFAVTLTGPSFFDVVVDFQTFDGSATVADNDYVAQAGQLHFAPAAGPQTQTISVPVVGDHQLEGSESFSVQLTDAMNATFTRSLAISTITNDDTVPTLAIGDVTLVEGDTGMRNFDFTVTLTGASFFDVFVDFRTVDGSATVADNDYLAQTGPVHFAPGAGPQTQTITVPVQGDHTFEPVESFVVNLLNPVNADILRGSGLGLILNDDELPTIVINDVSVTEGVSGTTADATFIVSLSNPSSSTVTVTVSTADGTATAGSDYQAIVSQLIAFAPREITKPVTVTVFGDNAFEPDETLVVNLTGASFATIGDPQGIGTILNDDVNQPPAVTADVNSVAEDAVPNTAAGNVLTNDVDTDGPQPLSVSKVNGAGANVGAVVNGMYGTLELGSGGSYTYTLDNSRAVVQALSANQVVQDLFSYTAFDGSAEDSSTLTVTITGVNDAPVLSPMFPVTLVEGEILMLVATATDVDTPAQDLRFRLGTGSPAGAAINETTGVFTWTPTDAQWPGTYDVQVIVDDGALTDDQIVPITVQSSVTLDVDGDGAANETDGRLMLRYLAALPDSQLVAGLTFAEPATRTTGAAIQAHLDFVKTRQPLMLDSDGDGLLNPFTDGRLLYRFLQGVSDTDLLAGYVIAPGAPRDTAEEIRAFLSSFSPTFSTTDVTVTEGNNGTTTSATFTISLSSPSSETVTVTVSTADGVVNPATADNDYQAIVSQLLTFNPGETSKPVTVTVLGDDTFEPDETFFVNLTNATNATISDPQGVGTILNARGISLSGVPDWVEQGPGPISDISSIFPIGAIEAIVANPSNPDRVLVGTVNGGIWRTLNALDPTPVWIPLTDQWPSLSISAIAYSPLDVTNNTLFAGTGNFSSGVIGGPAIGALRTTDGGDTWVPIGSEFNGKRVRSIVPASLGASLASQVVLVATVDGGGVYRSTDGGNTFALVSGSDGSTDGLDNDADHITDEGGELNLPAGDASHLVRDPGNVNRFYVALPGQGVFRSDNGGANWVQVNIGLIGVGAASRMELAVHDRNGQNVVYAAVLGIKDALPGVRFIGLFRSTDQGTTWRLVENQQQIPQSGQGSVHFSMVADPTAANVLFIRGDVDPGYRVLMDDADPTLDMWTPLFGIDGRVPGVDSRDMVFDAQESLLAAVDQGIYRLINPNDALTRQWVSVNGNLRITEFYSVAYDSLNGTIFGGAQDIGTLRQRGINDPLFPLDWPLVQGGDGGVTQVSVVDANGDDLDNDGDSQIDEGDELNAIHYTSRERLEGFTRRTLDNQNVERAAAGISLIVDGTGGKSLYEVDPSIQFIQPYVLNALDPSRILIGTSYLYESFDRGDTLIALGGLTQSGTPANPVGRVAAMAYGGRSGGIANEDVAWMGTGEKLLLRAGAGESFVELTGYPGFGVRDLALNPDDWRSAYVIDLFSHVYTTEDAGATWTDLTGDLNTVTTDLRTIEVVNPTTNPGDEFLVVGGEGGVYRTLNPGTGARWTEVGRNLPNALVTDLRFDSADDLLLAGTFGRGAWTLSNAGTAIAQSGVLHVDGDVTFSATDDSIALRLNADNQLLLDASLNGSMPGLSIPVSTLSHILVNGFGGNDTLTLDFSNGNLIPFEGMAFDGGEDAGALGDVLSIVTKATDSVTHLPSPTGPGRGIVVVNGRVIMYAGVEVITLEELGPLALDLISEKMVNEGAGLTFTATDLAMPAQDPTFSLASGVNGNAPLSASTPGQPSLALSTASLPLAKSVTAQPALAVAAVQARAAFVVSTDPISSDERKTTGLLGSVSGKLWLKQFVAEPSVLPVEDPNRDLVVTVAG